jgi:chitodextrinase
MMMPPTSPVPSVPSAPNPSPHPPSAPTDLVATRVTSVSVTLTWTASVRGCCEIAGYDIPYYQSFDDVVRLHTVGNVTTATVTAGIVPRQQYSFQVMARDTMGRRSGWSTTVTVVTPATDTGPDVTPPTAPSGLTAGEVSPAGVPLSWSPSTDDVGVTGYNVYWFDGWFSSRVVATVTGTTYTATLPAARNQFYVRARDAVGNVSIATPAITVTTTTTTPPVSEPPAPPSCRVAYTTTSEWSRGFTANVTVTNTGESTLDGWTLAYTFGGDQRITSSWSSTFTQTGAAVTIRHAGWNGRLAPGASTTVGLQGNWSASNAAPAAYTLGGSACATG